VHSNLKGEAEANQRRFAARKRAVARKRKYYRRIIRQLKRSRIGDSRRIRRLIRRYITLGRRLKGTRKTLGRVVQRFNAAYNDVRRLISTELHPHRNATVCTMGMLIHSVPFCAVVASLFPCWLRSARKQSRVRRLNNALLDRQLAVRVLRLIRTALDSDHPEAPTRVLAQIRSRVATGDVLLALSEHADAETDAEVETVLSAGEGATDANDLELEAESEADMAVHDTEAEGAELAAELNAEANAEFRDASESEDAAEASESEAVGDAEEAEVEAELAADEAAEADLSAEGAAAAAESDSESEDVSEAEREAAAIVANNADSDEEMEALDEAQDAEDEAEASADEAIDADKQAESGAPVTEAAAQMRMMQVLTTLAATQPEDASVPALKDLLDEMIRDARAALRDAIAQRKAVIDAFEAQHDRLRRVAFRLKSRVQRLRRRVWRLRRKQRRAGRRIRLLRRNIKEATRQIRLYRRLLSKLNAGWTDAKQRYHAGAERKYGDSPPSTLSSPVQMTDTDRRALCSSPAPLSFCPPPVLLSREYRRKLRRLIRMVRALEQRRGAALIPSSISASISQRYRWEAGPWSACSRDCDDGKAKVVKSRKVACRNFARTNPQPTHSRTPHDIPPPPLRAMRSLLFDSLPAPLFTVPPLCPCYALTLHGRYVSLLLLCLNRPKG
jgi:hypothetical protein